MQAFSAESDLSRNGRAKKIVYAWGTASADSLRQVGQALPRSEVSVHVTDLINVFGQAVVRYIDEVADHPQEHKRFFQSVGRWLVGVNSSAFDQFLETQKAAENQWTDRSTGL
jgi:hypothetical protein